MQEEWREIEDFPYYMISNYGRLRHVERPETVRKISLNDRGFPVVTLYGPDGKTRYLRQINKLVATAFLPPPLPGEHPGDMESNSVWHIDGDLTNCRADNLRWEWRARVLEWNEMNRGKSKYRHFARVKNNRTGAIYDNTYECALAEGIIESRVIWMVERMPQAMQDSAWFSYVYGDEEDV
jgi:NUMOD4 motif